MLNRYDVTHSPSEWSNAYRPPNSLANAGAAVGGEGPESRDRWVQPRPLAHRKVTLHEQPFVNRNGEMASWEDLLNCIAMVVKRMYPDLTSRDIMDDAIQDTMERLVTYWVNLESAQDPSGDGLSFRLALFYGVRYARTRLGEMLDGDELPQGIRPLPPSSEVANNIDNDEGLFAMLNECDDTNLSHWFQAVMSGESARSEARRTGVPRQTIDSRRKRQQGTARRIAHRYGLNA